MNLKLSILMIAACASGQPLYSISYMNFADPHVYVSAPAFITAAGTDNMQSVVNYIASGSNISMQSVDGSTALHHAVREMNTDIVKVLLEHNAQVNDKGAYGYTPLHLAIINNDELIIKLLLTMPGIDVNITSDTGKTPLHLAAERGLAAVASELLTLNARTDITDAAGLTALQVAQQRGKKDAVDIINAFIDSRAAQAPAPAPAPAPVAHEDDEADECPICSDEFDEDENYTPCCKKPVHNACMNQWRIRNNSCPLCRANLTSRALLPRS